MARRVGHRGRLGAAPAGVTVERSLLIQPGVLKSPIARDYGSAKAVVAAIVTSSGGPKQVAHRFGLSETMIYDMMHPGSEKEMSLARVAALTQPDCPFAAEYLAALAGGAFLPGLAVHAETNLGRLTAEFARETGEAIGSIIGSLADGDVSPAEARADLREVDQAMRVLAAMRAELLALIAEGDHGE